MTYARTVGWFALFALTAAACNGSSLGNAPLATTAPGSTDAPTTQPSQVPFEVKGELEGLVLGWFDAQGLHTASKRSDVPEHRRAQVRIDSLDIAPEQRLDPSKVYVADLRAPKPDGSYAVQIMERAAFDALVDKTAGVAIHAPAAPAQPSDGDSTDHADPDRAAHANAAPVIIYMASWCGACKASARYLRQRGVPFVERDIEKDRDANAEMRRKAQAAGVNPRGVPVIDFRGTLVLGFDQARLDQLISRSAI